MQFTATATSTKIRIVLVCLLFSATASLSSAQVEPPPPPDQGETNSLRDAQSYAAENGVSVDEAVRRIGLQSNEIAQLGQALESQEGSTFAGLWIDHQPTFRVVAAFTGGGEEALARHLGTGPLAEIIQVQTVSNTLAALASAQQTVSSAISRLGVRVESSIDVRQNIVNIYVTNASPVQTAISTGVLSLPATVKLVVLPALSTNYVDIYGGAILSSCTSGFGVANSSGTLGIITAAHCPNTLSFNGVNLPFQQESYSGSYDIQWHTTPGLRVRNLIWDGQAYRTMTTAQAYQTVGSYVCKFGKTAGYQCGDIVSNTFTKSDPSVSATFSPTWVLLRSRTGAKIGAEGDSGGPLFVGNSAAGIVSGGLGNDLVYMPIKYVSGLGLSVPAGQ